MSRTFRWVTVVAVTVMMMGAGWMESASGQPVKGQLFIIGGGDRTPDLMRQFLDLAGGAGKARVIVVPNASGAPEKAGAEEVKEFLDLGAGSAEYVFLTREEALNPAAAARFDGATGVFFSGGDQARLTKALLGTPVHEMFKKLYLDGAVIGGTSAGAAVMSKVMITGDELINKDTVNIFTFIKKGNVETKEGFGFLTNCIIDQHFVARKRHNRLISLVLEHPDLVGVGIDESTAIIVKPDLTFRVAGEGTVVIYDPTRAATIRTDKNGNLSGMNITTHVLQSGDRYNLMSRAVSPHVESK